MKVSANLLTFNRGKVVADAFAANIANAGAVIGELVWVDNGSEPADWREMNTVVAAAASLYGFSVTRVRHDRNLGVAKGYNRAAALSTGDLVVIMGCDTVMPQNWLRDMIDAIESDPTVAIVSLYTTRQIDTIPERQRGEPYQFGHLTLTPCLPFDRRIYKRVEILGLAGYLREDFGLYGWEDNEWGERVLRLCTERGWKSLNVKVGESRHLGYGDEEYLAFKKSEVDDPKKQEMLRWCGENGFPFYSPF